MHLSKTLFSCQHIILWLGVIGYMLVSLWQHIAKMSSYKRFHKLQGGTNNHRREFCSKDVNIWAFILYTCYRFIYWLELCKEWFHNFVGVHLVVLCASNKPIYSHISWRWLGIHLSSKIIIIKVKVSNPNLNIHNSNVIVVVT
jgi:hypothetical protein